MFFAEAPASRRLEIALPPLHCPRRTHRSLACCWSRRLFLGRCNRRRWCRWCVVWDELCPTPLRLQVQSVLAEAESGSLKLVHCCWLKSPTL